MNYWLMKSEPDEFGIEDLKQRPDQIEPWDGVRNYQARNMMRDQMKVGDLAFFYHSNTKPPGIVGIVEIVREGYPDPTQFDPDDKHYDPKSDPEKPRWYLVDVKFKATLPRKVTLHELKRQPKLEGMKLLARGNRLSVMPVEPDHWAHIIALAEQDPAG
ncbi:EVE domain-containing protein [Alkalilimnicola ehrlichii]|uniref:EVE domain-containing protein n=1 Tax=Alkalilimnicola ehrlichii TaxID=351052 RepID=UPI003B9F4EAF